MLHTCNSNILQATGLVLFGFKRYLQQNEHLQRVVRNNFFIMKMKDIVYKQIPQTGEDLDEIIIYSCSHI